MGQNRIGPKGTEEKKRRKVKPHSGAEKNSKKFYQKTLFFSLTI